MPEGQKRGKDGTESDFNLQHLNPLIIHLSFEHQRRTTKASFVVLGEKSSHTRGQDRRAVGFDLLTFGEVQKHIGSAV